MRKTTLIGLAVLVLVSAGLTFAWVESPQATIGAGGMAAVAQEPSADQAITDSGQAAIKAAIAAVGPAVVRVDVVGTAEADTSVFDFFSDPFFRRFFGEPDAAPEELETQSVGSGVIVGFENQKIVLTNAHVVDGAKSITLTDTEGYEWEATVIGSDELLDIAVLRISGDASGLPVATLGNSSGVEPGDWAIAIGNPLGLSYTVTLGIISATDRSIPKPEGNGSFHDLIQTDAAINPGNSGGPLVNSRGEVIGINTMIARSSGNGIAIEGINFAVAIDGVKDVLDQLVNQGSVARGWLGVGIADVTPAAAAEFGIDVDLEGALILEAFPGDPADVAGIQTGDVVVRIGEATIASADDLARTVALLGAGVTVEIELVRGDDTLTVSATLDPRPSESELVGYRGKTPAGIASGDLGLTVGPVTSVVAEHLGLNSTKGVVIMEIVAEGRAENAGLEVGDVILDVEGTPIASVEDWNAAIEDLEAGETVMLAVYRDGRLAFVEL
ncbi:MAG: trypsin-like peptidase domain-containing protein [Candidatus Bipolaricaulota bacterium]